MGITRSTTALPRASSRLLTTLTSTATKLVPPYSHSSSSPNEPSAALRPPYSHSPSPSVSGSGSALQGQGVGVQPKLKYALIDRSAQRAQRAEAYAAWAKSLGGEEEIKRIWNETLAALQAQRQGVDGVCPVSLPSLGFMVSWSWRSERVVVEC